MKPSLHHSARRPVERLDELIGNTPLMRLPVADPSTAFFAKLECFNPLSSSKDRAAAAMLAAAESAGRIAPGGTIIEATSGNTGIALAALCAARGYRCIIVLPANATAERIATLTMLGAIVEMSPPEQMLAGAIKLAEQIHRDNSGSHLIFQHENASNVAAHYETTGPEILRDLEGNIDVLVCGIGTGGTLTGAARYLLEHRPQLEVIAVEPEGSPLLTQGRAGPHRIPGLNGGFLAPVTDTQLITDAVAVGDHQALACVQKLARRHGLLVGISSGAVVHAVEELAASGKLAHKRVVAVLPDSGDRYLSMMIDQLSLTPQSAPLTQGVDDEAA